jgi:Secretion system C-terminal sorting domain
MATKPRRLAAATALLLLVIVVASLLNKDAWRLSDNDLAGTMGASASAVIEVDGLAGNWDDEPNLSKSLGELDHDFQIGFDARNRSGTAGTENFRVFFSRDEEFDSNVDCLADQRTVQIQAGQQARVVFTTATSLVNCLDAGPWRVAVQSGFSESWEILPDVYHIAGGEAQLELSSASKHVEHRGSMKLDLQVHRESTEFGVQGLYEHEVDVWLKREDQLCLIEASPLTLKRDPVRREGGSWDASPSSLSVDIGDAMRVEAGAGFLDPFNSGRSSRQHCPSCVRPQTTGRCSLGEGLWQVALGPAIEEFFTVGEVFVHASPTTIDPTTIDLSMAQGRVVTVERTGYNPSGQSVRWSAVAERSDQDWLVGMENQSLAGREAGALSFTVSAEGLAPGFYSGAFLFRADDFYGTEIRIPVELKVERSRTGSGLQSGSGEGGTEEPAVTFSLENYPNPFSGRTTIRLNLPEPGPVRIVIYDLTGREVRVLTDQWLTSGPYEVLFDANGLPSGTYLSRVVTAQGTRSGTMTLVN